MEYDNYEAAIQALLAENQGVLPDLTTYVCVALAGSAASTPVHLPVAELLALTLAEIAADAALAEPVASKPAVRLKMPADLHHQGGPVVMKELLKRAVVSVN